MSLLHWAQQNGWYLMGISKHIFMSENYCTSIWNSMKFVTWGPIDSTGSGADPVYLWLWVWACRNELKEHFRILKTNNIRKTVIFCTCTIKNLYLFLLEISNAETHTRKYIKWYIDFQKINLIKANFLAVRVISIMPVSNNLMPSMPLMPLHPASVPLTEPKGVKTTKQKVLFVKLTK